jgi:hypothetical protein
MQPSGNPLYTQVAIYVVIAALLIFRNTRPQRLTITRMFVSPAIFAVLTALTIWGGQQVTPAPPWEIAVALVLGALAGIPLGLLRGHHTTVRATEKPGVMYLDPSWIVLAIWLGAFAARSFLRYIFAGGPLAAVVGDGLLMFAATTIIVSYYAIYKKYKELEVAAGQA